ncbi:TVP38/TMEM64 family protein [Cohnella pontilimi]|uniref:TVP38/TMEM64 family membrane protein n=1 Tax=Cohnella pontilimi TaxID=2564100 RepID=A0A4U0FG51_9BACL|nr:VTT domain-containing protein [Cohnella pontilimi]TJY43976.1 TVP38/TMEM64 family protein [Cohnella pontilimi]
MRKWLVISLYLAAAVSLWIWRGSIAGWLEADDSGMHFALVLILGFIIALIPAIPYTVVAVLIGAKYGPILGTVLNLAMSAGAALALFLIVRYTFTPEQRRKAAGMKGVFRITVFAERNPFAAVLFARMLPLAPAQAVNIFSALTRMRFIPYATATVLGKLPFLVTMGVLGQNILMNRDWHSIIFIIFTYIVFLCSVFVVYKRVTNRKM